MIEEMWVDMPNTSGEMKVKRFYCRLCAGVFEGRAAALRHTCGMVKKKEGRSSKLVLAMKPRRQSAPARRKLKMTAVRRIVELEAREMVRRAVIERLVEDAVTRLAEEAASHEDEGVKNEALFDAYG